MAEQQLDAEKKKCIEVKKLDGESVSVSLRAEDTVGELRKLIQQKKDFCVPSLTFHLFLRVGFNPFVLRFPALVNMENLRL